MKNSPTIDAPAPRVASAGGSALARKRNGNSFVTWLLKVRPLERNICALAVLLGGAGLVASIIRESSVGSNFSQFIMMTAIPAVVVVVATLGALPKQDESYKPVFRFLTYGVIAATLAFMPTMVDWASRNGYGASPSLVPGLAFMVCLLAPFAIPNQMAFGFGSAIPKLLIMLGAMHLTDNSSIGITASNYMLSPQSAIVSMAIISALCSFIFMLFRYRNPAWLQIVVGLVAFAPLVVTLEGILVHQNAM